MRPRFALASAALALSLAAGCSSGTKSTPPVQKPLAAAPQFAPAAGTYTSAQTVTITATTTGAAIYYTTDGTAPTTSSALYTAPITVASTMTIQAIVAADGYNNSAVAAAAYTITPHQATSYYVSPSGSDAAPGTQTQPFATVAFAAARLQAGDTLYLRAGDYHETVSLRQSGTAAAPITIQAYPGECPTLIGATPVAGPWTVYSGAIYRAASPTQPLQVFAAGQLLNEARWPNTAVEDFANMTYALADSGTQDYITYSALPDTDLTGAWVRVMAGQAWVAYDRQVASHDRASGKLTFSAPINALPQLVPRRGSHFFLFGKLELLDAPGEWWWDPTQQQLYVWPPDGGSPEGQRVEAGIAPAVLDLSGRSYVTVKGLAARGGWFNLQSSTNCTVQDFHLWAPNWIRTFDGYSVSPQHIGGVDVSGTGNVLEGGSVRHAGRSGIHLAGSGNTVRQVTVEDSVWTWANEGGICLEGDQALVENNTIRRTAAAGILLAPRSRVLANLVEDSCLFVEDCGNVNAWNMDGQGAEIAYNILSGNHSRWGASIYLDLGSRNFFLHDNLAQRIAWGGANITGINDVENNTFADVGHQGIACVPDANGADWSAGRILHNQLGEPFPLSVALNQPASFIPDYGSYMTYVPLAPQPGPRRVEVDWDQLAQPGWSQQQVPLNLSQVDSIAFGFEPVVGTFDFTIGNLRLLPAGGTGDAGAVAVTGTSWTVSSSGGSTCTLTASGPATWGASGSAVFNGASLTAPLPPALKDLTAYRGLAFELAGTATRTFNFQGYQDVDNGPDPAPGRGATLPASVGADPAGAAPVCAVSTAAPVSAAIKVAERAPAQRAPGQ